jgi:DNA-directed RNA polymerase specialized sigma24 family protein
MTLQQMLYREAIKVLGDTFEAEDAVQNLYVRL